MNGQNKYGTRRIETHGSVRCSKEDIKKKKRNRIMLEVKDQVKFPLEDLFISRFYCILHTHTFKLGFLLFHHGINHTVIIIVYKNNNI